MSLHRFFLTDSLLAGAGTRVELPLAAEDRHHGVSVLRLRAGEEIEAVDPLGGVWRVRVDEAGRESLMATLLVHTEPNVRRRPQVCLVQGVAKGDKMDTIVRQAVEVGVDRIVPVLTERSVVRLDARKRAERGERWRRIAKAAAEQAHRDRVVEVEDPVELRVALTRLGDLDATVVLWEDERCTRLEAALAPWRGRTDALIGVVVGPEGGLAADEIDVLRAGGAFTASLGESILRTETAAVVAAALAVHELERE